MLEEIVPVLKNFRDRIYDMRLLDKGQITEKEFLNRVVKKSHGTS